MAGAAIKRAKETAHIVISLALALFMDDVKQIQRSALFVYMRLSIIIGEMWYFKCDD